MCSLSILTFCSLGVRSAFDRPHYKTIAIRDPVGPRLIPLCNCQRAEIGSRIHSLIQKCTSWWRCTGSNRGPPACKAGALPTELHPPTGLVGTPGLEPGTSALSGLRSNQLSYAPLLLLHGPRSQCTDHSPLNSVRTFRICGSPRRV